MHKIWKTVSVAMSAMFFSPFAFAMPQTFPLAQVAEGVQGTAYTVVDASREVRSFDVDLVGVMDGSGEGKMIMAKAYGPVVEQTGGILQGMSGSPVYVNDRLVGAVAAGLKDMTPYTFFIRPIDDMLKIWKLPDKKNKTHIKTINLAEAEKEHDKFVERMEKRIAGSKAKEREKPKAERAAKEQAAEIEQEETPKAEVEGKTHKADEAKKPKEGEQKAALFVSGFDDAGLAYLKKGLKGFGVEQFYRTGGGSGVRGSDYNATLAPGSAVGVALVYGDFSVGATGTVTAVDGKRILGFGHPFLHKGNVNYFMTDATVVGTISGQSAGMKIANFGNIIGRVSQDREAGIAGTLGTFPSVVPMKVNVEDKSLGRKASYGARIAYDEELLPELSAGIAYASLTKTSDTLGEGTADVTFAIRTNAVPTGKFERKNMFYSIANVGQAAMMELAQAMHIICANTEEESDITDVEVRIKMSNERKTASLVSAVPDKVKVKPGETVNFKTTIKPYRKEKEVLNIPYTVPKTQRPGTLNLDVRGGGLMQINPLQLLAQAGLDLSAEEDKAKSTAEKLEELKDTTQNNEIVIAPGVQPVPLSEREQKKMIEEAYQASMDAAMEDAKHRKVELLKDKGKKNKMAKVATGYVIDNVIRAHLEVEKR